MTEQSPTELRLEVFEAVTIALRALFASASDQHLAAFTAEPMGKEMRWVQQIAWDEIGRRDDDQD